MIKIKNNALFIADSHYPHHGDDFLELLKDITLGKIDTSQIFLMGDNFDLLFGYNTYIKTFSQEIIDLLNTLSITIEIHYFEGNHDFCLKPLFNHISVYSREEQPIICKIGTKRVALSHGDKYDTGVGYEIYSKFLRNKITLLLLKPWEKKIINSRIKKLSSKNICSKFNNFEAKVEKIMKFYTEVDMVIEGHFHQAREINNYISLPSLACQYQVALCKDNSILFKTLNELRS